MMSGNAKMSVKPLRRMQDGQIMHWDVRTAAGSVVHEAPTQVEAMTWAYEFAALQGWTK